MTNSVQAAPGQDGRQPEKGQRRVLVGQNHVLNVLARGASLDQVFHELALVVEELFVDATCAMFLVDTQGSHLRLLAAPSMPDTYDIVQKPIPLRARIEPSATAVMRREPVMVADLEIDSFWRGLNAVAQPAGLRSIWAQPILDDTGNARGAMTLYFRAANVPDEEIFRSIDALIPLARLAIEHDRRARALESADNNFTSLAASIPGVVYQRVVTVDGNIKYTYISEGARDIFGVEAAKILADPNALFDCHGPEYRQDFRERLLAASRTLETWDVEAEIVTPDGERKWTHAIARPERRSDGSVIWNGVILDATRIKRAHMALAAADRAKSEFLANMSHELRTPLNAIIGFSEMIANECFGDVGHEEYAKCAKDIHDSGQNLLAIINDVLDLAKVESGKMELEESWQDVRETVDSSVRLVQDRAAEKGLAVEYCIDQGVSQLFADERKVKQILVNLLSNAVRFTPMPGKVEVMVHFEDDGDLSIVVRDSGPGIAQAEHEAVLSPFVQADSGLDRKFDGTGLGLPLSKAMAELHGGRLELDSDLGQGTTVTVRFPAKRVTDAPNAPPYCVGTDAPESRDVASNARSLRILLAEDNEVNQLLIMTMLTKVGHQVDVASNGAEAVSMVCEGPYDLILMDMQMPEMDGLEATRRIREMTTKTAAIPIIAITANAMTGEKERCLQAGMNDYLPKPVDRAKLSRKLAFWGQFDEAAASLRAEQEESAAPNRKAEITLDGLLDDLDELDNDPSPGNKSA